MASVVGTFVLLLAIIPFTTAANVKVDCKSSENRGQYGQVSMLECVIKTTEEATDAMIKVVTWKKIGSKKTLPVVVFHSSVLQPTTEPRFWFSEQNFNVKTRNVSLIVNNTQINDRGEYECRVMTDRGSADPMKINLTVTAKYSEPKVRTPEKDTFICNSEGGYPKGTIRWFDQDKKELTSSSQDPEEMDDGRFNLISTLKNPASSQSYTCSVYNANGDKEGGTTFELDLTSKDHESLTGEEGKEYPPSKIVAPVVVIGSLIVGLLILLLLKRRRSTEARRRLQHQSTTPLMSPQTTHTPVYQDEEKANCLDGEDAERGKKCDHSGEMNAVDEEGLQVMIPLSAALN